MRTTAADQIARRCAGAALAALTLALLLAPPAARADPDALWKVVHGQCVPNETAKGDPSPCLDVSLDRGFAALKDRTGATQVLVIPTAKVTGIEDPAVLAAKAPNYWQDAWAARWLMVGYARQPLSRNELSLAVNSVDGRSQNQLHIHVDCIRADVRDALDGIKDQVGAAWAPLTVTLAGHHYNAMRLDGEDLGARNPFKLLANGDPAARKRMNLETIVAAPVVFKGGAPGFLLLSDHADPASGDYGSGEELMDHDCKVLQGG
jgi:CDP-diacylglycerol pyrophosphatase